MSKIGKISISIPEKVKAVLSGNVLNIEGPLGKKSLNVDLDMFNVDIAEGKEISIKPKKLDQNSKRLWGMNRSLINNAVIGSSKGYEKTLELVGVGCGLDCSVSGLVPLPLRAAIWTAQYTKSSDAASRAAIWIACTSWLYRYSRFIR